jgi:5'-deoxynucleotidase YfbR-like HD superfamily hydrolase
MLLIADYLTSNKLTPRLARAIMYHDLHELHLGDIPHPVKHNPICKDQIAKLEHEIDLYMDLVIELTECERGVLKLADMLEFVLYLLQERRLGNRNNDHIFSHAMNLATQYTDQFHHDEHVKRQSAKLLLDIDNQWSSYE